VELQSFSVSGMTLDRQQSATPAISAIPANSTWASAEDFIYTTDSSILSIDNNNHTVTGITPGTATVTASHKSGICSATFTVKVNKNAIIIIPGIMGSELFLGDNTDAPFENDTPIWTASVFAKMQGVGDLLYIHNIFKSLRCNDDATSKYNVRTKRFTTKTELSTDEAKIYSNQCGTKDIYRNLFATLNQNSALTAQYTIDFFSYDWRLSNGISAQKLDSYINEMGYDKVVLIAHSMGGLVASGYLALGAAQRNKVKSVYYLASPLLGSVEMVNVWMNEDLDALELDLPVSSDILSIMFHIPGFSLKMLLSNFQSVYELIPTKKYFSLANQHYLSYKSYLYGDSPETTYTTYDDSRSALQRWYGIRNNLMNIAESFHDNLYINDSHISSLIESYYIYGNSYNTKSKMCHSTIYDMYGNILLRFSPSEFTQEGDKMVAKWSATLAGLYSDQTYHVKDSHTAVTQNTDVKNFIIQNTLGIYQHDNSNTSFIKGY